MRRLFSGALLAVLALSASAGDGTAPWQAKVSPRIWADLERGDASFLVVLAEQADLSGAAGLPSKEEKGAFVVKALMETAARTQGPVADALEAAGAQVRPFWVANFLSARGGYEALEAAARLPQVRSLEPDVPAPQDLPYPEAPDGGGPTPEAVEWNITYTNAPSVWAMGYTGQGVVVAGQDTGYQWDHPGLKAKYRGWNGATASHAYNWHDAVHSGGGSCGANAAAPCDDYGHGTHTMGSMVGDDNLGNQVGMAPGAKWIGCRNMDVGNGTPTTYAECFQFFLAPTDAAGANPDPSLAPHVMNNSWGCPTSEGCTDVNVLRTVTENCRAAGIVVVASAGNSGSGCSTVSDPPAIYEAAFSVGNHTSTGTISSSSSRGPVTVDGSNRMKPEISAPGSSIRSTYPGGAYTSMSGTSMAGPHVAGAVALLLSARPDLKGKVSVIEALLERSATAVPVSTCSGASAVTPNNVYGHGRLNVQAALTGDADGDGTNNLADCAPIDAAAWSLPSEARSLVVTPSGAGGAALSWTSPVTTGGEALQYDLLRGTTPSAFSCLAAGLSAPSTSDASTPAPGTAFYYLVRARNACGAGPHGTAAPAPACP